MESKIDTRDNIYRPVVLSQIFAFFFFSEIHPFFHAFLKTSFTRSPIHLFLQQVSASM